MFNKFKLSNLNKISLYYILILIKVSFAGVFIDLKKLYIYDIYFVVLDTGLYLYDFNTNDKGLIHKFKPNEFKNTTNDIINITELNYRHRAYIFCLINEYLFLFNEYNYKVYNYKINEIVPSQNYYYNIMPYKIEYYNISFFIALNKDKTNLEFYLYNFNLTKNKNTPKVKTFKNMNIENKMIRCQINSFSTFIICFYHSIINGKNNFVTTPFYINNMNLFSKNSKTKQVNNIIKQIKVATSYDNNFFVCYLDDTTAVCLTNDKSYEFSKINCKHDPNWYSEYKVLYFEQTDDFMLIKKKKLTTTILNNHDNKIKLCKTDILSHQTYPYAMIYDNKIKDYKLVNYKNFEHYYKSVDISILAKKKQDKYIEQAKHIIDKSNDKKELIKNLNEFIKYDINLDYIDENKELIIHKDKMTIVLTSTFIQNNKENIISNSTSINFGKCVNILKNVYNISEESDLYLLKIDIEQEYRNYPLIEYEFFYPLDNEKLDILNLSHCKDINIEILIPMQINESMDKYNPKSDYYNNICSKATSKNNTDIILNDRRNEFIKNNMSLCEENCELIGYDYNKKKSKCSCKIKTSLSLDENKLDINNILKNFIDIKKITNIEIVKCYKIVFNLKNMKNNLGFFIISFIIVLYFICLFIFYCKSLKNLIYIIFQIIRAKNIKSQAFKNQPIYSFKNKINNRKRNIEIIKIKIKKKSTFKNSKNQSSKIIIAKKNIAQKNNKNKNILTKERKDKLINILEYTDSELNSLSYKEAIKKDKRTYCKYYCFLLKIKQNILFSFYPIRDYNSQIIKSFLFFFYYTSDLAINTLFFIDETMHKIYEDSGKFNFLYQLPQITYSYLISSVINFIIEYLSMSENAIISIKSKRNINMNAKKKIISKMKIKFCFFFIVTFLLLLIFLFYVSCFCCIYQNTQIHLIKDSLLSLAISTFLPFFTNLIPGIFRIPALRSKKHDKSCLYKISQFIEYF